MYKVAIVFVLSFVFVSTPKSLFAQEPVFSGYLEVKPYTGPIPTGPGVVHHDNPCPTPEPPRVIEFQPEKKATGMRRLTPEEIEKINERRGIKRNPPPQDKEKCEPIEPKGKPKE